MDLGHRQLPIGPMTRGCLADDMTSGNVGRQPPFPILFSFVFFFPCQRMFSFPFQSFLLLGSFTVVLQGKLIKMEVFIVQCLISSSIWVANNAHVNCNISAAMKWKKTLGKKCFKMDIMMSDSLETYDIPMSENAVLAIIGEVLLRCSFVCVCRCD